MLESSCKVEALLLVHGEIPKNKLVYLSTLEKPSSHPKKSHSNRLFVQWKLLQGSHDLVSLGNINIGKVSRDIRKDMKRAIDNERGRMRYQGGTILGGTSVKSLVLRGDRGDH